MEVQRFLENHAIDEENLNPDLLEEMESFNYRAPEDRNAKSEGQFPPGASTLGPKEYQH